MGYKHSPKVYRLAFDDYEGLEVRARSVSLDEFLSLVEIAGKTDPDDLERMFRGFADALVSWNLEDEDGTPVPATYEGIKGQDLDLILDIIGGWQDAIGSVPAPLAKPSDDGRRSPAA